MDFRSMDMVEYELGQLVCTNHKKQYYAAKRKELFALKGFNVSVSYADEFASHWYARLEPASNMLTKWALLRYGGTDPVYFTISDVSYVNVESGHIALTVERHEADRKEEDEKRRMAVRAAVDSMVGNGVYVRIVCEAKGFEGTYEHLFDVAPTPGKWGLVNSPFVTLLDEEDIESVWAEKYRIWVKLSWYEKRFDEPHEETTDDYPCPKCGEARINKLVWVGDDEYLHCLTCGKVYQAD